MGFLAYQLLHVEKPFYLHHRRPFPCDVLAENGQPGGNHDKGEKVSEKRHFYNMHSSKRSEESLKFEPLNRN